MSAAVNFSPGSDLGSKLDAITSLAIEGSQAPEVRDRAMLAARVAGSDDPWAGFAQLYGELLGCMVVLRDPGHDAGFDRIEPAAVTLARCGGDCDDATVLVLAAARAFGFRGRIVIVSAPTPDGPIPQHAYASVERTPGVWMAADLFEGLPLGVDPSTRYPEAISEGFPIEDRAAALGFLGGLFNVVASWIGGNAQKKVAKTNLEAAGVQAGALNEQSAAQERIAAENARVQLEAIAAGRQSDAMNAVLAGRAQNAAADLSRDVLAFARDAAAPLMVVMALRALAPVAESVVRGGA